MLRTRSLVLLLVLPALLPGAKYQDWKTGKVLDSATAKTYVQTGATTNTTVTASGNSADATNRTTIQSMAIRDTQLVIVTDDFAYVVEDTRTQSGFSTVPWRDHSGRFRPASRVPVHRGRQCKVLPGQGDAARNRRRREGMQDRGAAAGAVEVGPATPRPVSGVVP